jgi:hypothetical protein
VWNQICVEVMSCILDSNVCGIKSVYVNSV